MTTFDDRQKHHETKFAHNEELEFKINARRYKLLGLWAAEKLGKSGAEAEAYAKDLVLADFDAKGDEDVLGKLLDDFGRAKVSASGTDIKREAERLLAIARDQVTKG